MNDVAKTDYTVNEVWQMAGIVAKSELFGMKTQEEAASLMLLAQAEGLHPAIAARDYYIIKGRPSLKADTMLARFQEAGGKVEWLELSNDIAKGKFSHPQGGTVTIEWTYQMAEDAELTQKKNRDGSKNMWVKFPRQMLRARAISEGIRTIFPGVVAGTYAEEEVRDFDDKPKFEPKDRGLAQEIKELVPDPKANSTKNGNLQEAKKWIKEAKKQMNLLHYPVDLEAFWQENSTRITRLMKYPELAEEFKELYKKRKQELNEFTQTTVIEGQSEG